MTPEQERAEIRKLSEQNRALREVRQLQQTGQDVPKELLARATGRIGFKSAGARRQK